MTEVHDTEAAPSPDHACLVTLDTTHSRRYSSVKEPRTLLRSRTSACHIPIGHLMAQDTWGDADDCTIPCIVLNPDGVRISERNWLFYIEAILSHESIHCAIRNLFGEHAEQVDMIDNVDGLTTIYIRMNMEDRRWWWPAQ